MSAPCHILPSQNRQTDKQTRQAMDCRAVADLLEKQRSVLKTLPHFAQHYRGVEEKRLAPQDKPQGLSVVVIGSEKTGKSSLVRSLLKGASMSYHDLSFGQLHAPLLVRIQHSKEDCATIRRSSGKEYPVSFENQLGPEQRTAIISELLSQVYSKLAFDEYVELCLGSPLPQGSAFQLVDTPPLFGDLKARRAISHALDSADYVIWVISCTQILSASVIGELQRQLEKNTRLVGRVFAVGSHLDLINGPLLNYAEVQNAEQLQDQQDKEARQNVADQLHKFVELELQDRLAYFCCINIQLTLKTILRGLPDKELPNKFTQFRSFLHAQISSNLFDHSERFILVANRWINKDRLSQKVIGQPIGMSVLNCINKGESRKSEWNEKLRDEWEAFKQEFPSKECCVESIPEVVHQGMIRNWNNSMVQFLDKLRNQLMKDQELPHDYTQLIKSTCHQLLCLPRPALSVTQMDLNPNPVPQNHEVAAAGFCAMAGMALSSSTPLFGGVIGAVAGSCFYIYRTCMSGGQTPLQNCLDNLFSKIQRDFSDRLDKTVESIKIIANCWDYEQELLLQVKSNETQHILANCWVYEQKLLLQSQIVEIK